MKSLLDRLKHKPIVQPNVGVKVIITPPSKEIVTAKEIVKPVIIAEKDEGKRAMDILEKIKQKKLSIVTKKYPEPEIQAVISKAPIIDEPKKKKSKKLPKESILLVEEEENVNDDLAQLPEGGPRLEETRLEAPEEVPGLDHPPIIEGVKKRISKKVVRGVIPIGPELLIKIGDTSLDKRLPPSPELNLMVSSYYMNNREIFINFINGLFEPYREELLDESKGISCEDIGKDTGSVSLLTHQKIVRDYMNLNTPYRGLLLYHGLGSGKTCTSIAIAEGMKSAKKIIIMTPASLKRNYMEEIKKCGDLLYRKNQYWEWISIDDHLDYIDPLSAALQLPREYVRRNRGAWLTNVTKKSNYSELSTSDKKILNDQLDEMIKNKYKFINYNGLRREKFLELTNNFTENIFDNAVVIIDEAHNLISRIVNKINKISKFSEKPRGPGSEKPFSLSLMLYEALLRAENCRIVLLTGTPIINYSNEIGILFNILRGYIKTWSFTLNTESSQKLSKETIDTIFLKEKVLDYVDYVPSSKTLTVTRNPYGFENKITNRDGYKGVTNEFKEKRNEKGEVELGSDGNALMEERGQITDAEFIKRIIKLLKKNDITAIVKGTNFTVNTALPDTLDEFLNTFIDKVNGSVKNVDKFKRRIIGLTSYFRSAQEGLLPNYDKNFDRHEVIIPMSDYQFKIYEDYRFLERKSEQPSSNKKKSQGQIDLDGIFKEPSSTYRIFSRLACNFVMPTPPGRPTPAEFREITMDKILKSKNVILITEILDNFKKILTSNKLPLNSDIQNNFNEFIYKVPDRNLGYYKPQIEEILEVYAKAVSTKKYRGNIENFVKQIGRDDIFKTFNERMQDNFEKNKNKKATKMANTLAKAQEKEAKEQAKAQEKEAKEQAKAQEKEAKEQAKAQEKEAKELAKAKEKEEKEKEKAAKIEERDRKKAEEKAEKERLKAEEKERKKAERVKKGGSFEDVEDEDFDEDLNEDLNEDLKEDLNEDLNKDLKEDLNDDLDENSYKGGAGTPELEEEDDEEEKINPAERLLDNAKEDDLIELEGYNDEDALLREVEELEGDEILEKMGDADYKEAVKQAYKYLKLHARQFLLPEGLKTYSPKYLAMLENIQDPAHIGLNLVYSQFRTMEGLGIFALTLETNGFARFKIKRTASNLWELDMSEEDMGKPCYALYTGTETGEEREIIRNIYNGDWNYIPNNIAIQLRAKSSNNNRGEIIKVLMITSAGSEGINLRNTRYVHIMEPYWHPVRLEQVIGRARRICSHQNLPKELQTVEVFIYIMTLTKSQIDSEFAIELRLKDVSKNPPFAYQTSDEKLYEILTIKEQLTSQLLTAVKETSIDCATYLKSNTKEGLVCLSFGQPNVNDFAYNPNLTQDENDTVAGINRVTIDWEAREFIHPVSKRKYMLRVDTFQVYDYESVLQAKRIPGFRPQLIGKLVGDSTRGYEIVPIKV